MYAQLTDEEVYQVAQKINITRMQRVMFEEWFPTIIGRQLGRYMGFRRGVYGGVSVVFGSAAFRVRHMLVGNMVHRVGKWN